MSLIQSIVVPVDFSSPSRAAVARAAMLGKSTGASIHILHATRFPMPVMSAEFAIPGPAYDSIREAGQREVDRVAANLETQGLRVTREVDDSDAVDAIQRAIEQHDADLVVMGTHGQSGFQHFVLGSVAERTIRSATVPVMAVKEDEDLASNPFRRILFATDFSDSAHAAETFAVEFARMLDARIDVIHAFTIPSQYFAPYGITPPDELVSQLRGAAESMLQKSVDGIAKEGIPVESHFSVSLPSEAIPETASKLESDLIVMGTRGNTGLRHVFLGSVAERTLRSAPCSVVVVGAEP